MSKSFKPISFEKFRVGKLIKSSKKRFCWKFELDGTGYTLDLFSSRISGKRTIILDGNKVVSTKTSGMGSTYQVPIQKHKVIIYEIGDTQYDLRVDNMPFAAPTGTNTLTVPQDIRVRNKSSENLRWQQDNFGYSEKEPETGPKKRSESPPPVKSSPKKQEPSPVIKEPVKIPAPQVNVFDLFDAPAPVSNELPMDLFATPLTSEIKQDFNPFEEPKSKQEEIKIVEIKKEEPKANSDLLSFVDLDGLHLGDNYSPAYAKKIEEANRPVTINNANVQNVPMQNLLAQREQNAPVMNTMPGMGNMPNMQMPNMPNMQMPGMMMNTMGMMNPFMTGMMMGQWNGYYQNPNNQ